VSLLKAAPARRAVTRSEGINFMAKALLGTFHSDLRTPAHLLSENTRLRRRVGELESLVARLLEENDRLAAAEAVALLELRSQALQEMQPA
jgi:hypothetical protein